MVPRSLGGRGNKLSPQGDGLGLSKDQLHKWRKAYEIDKDVLMPPEPDSGGDRRSEDFQVSQRHLKPGRLKRMRKAYGNFVLR